MEDKKIMSKKHNSSLVDMVHVSLMAAMICLVTSVITIPSYNGVIHIGDSMVFAAAILLGKKKGTAASALGMFLFDMIHGYLIWAPFTLIIKGVMAYITADIYYRKEKKSLGYEIFAFSVSSVWMVAAYYLAGAIKNLLFSGKGITFKQALIASSYDIPGNILQVLVGILIAIPLLKAVTSIKKNSK